jgi:hypothetical protein
MFLLIKLIDTPGHIYLHLYLTTPTLFSSLWFITRRLGASAVISPSRPMIEKWKEKGMTSQKSLSISFPSALDFV